MIASLDVPSAPSVLYDLSAIFTLWIPAYGRRSHICNGKSALYPEYAASILQFGLAVILTTEEQRNLAHDYAALWKTVTVACRSWPFFTRNSLWAIYWCEI